MFLFLLNYPHLSLIDSLNYYHFFGPTIADLLERKRYSYTYRLDEIAAYLDDKSKERDYLIIHDGSDIDTIKGLIHSHPYHIIYSHPKEQYSNDYFLYIIQTLRENGISLYDMTPDHFLDKMLSNFAVHDCIEVHGKQITKHI